MHTHKCHFSEIIFSNERFVHFVQTLQVSTSGKVSPLLVEGRRSPATGDQEPPGRHRSGGASSSPLASAETSDNMTSSTGSIAGKLAKAGGKTSSSNLVKESSPGEVVSSSGKSRGGLSCLRPATLDDDPEPLMKSPERKQVMSPSGKSISDIFGKVSRPFFLFCERLSCINRFYEDGC